MRVGIKIKMIAHIIIKVTCLQIAISKRQKKTGNGVHLMYAIVCKFRTWLQENFNQ